VLGVRTELAEVVMREVYGSILDTGTPCVVTDFATAELVKVAANAFLATKISFINAMAEVCEAAGADVVTLSKAIGYDGRIGSRFLNAGLGFGGGCLPKDIRAFKARAGELGADEALSFLSEIDKINMRRRERAVEMAQQLVGGSFIGANVVVLGCAFKPLSDDVRDSPALNVAAGMQLRGAQVSVHDPVAIPNARKIFPTLNYQVDIDVACTGADLVLLATEWDEYKQLDPARIAGLVRKPILLDGRNALDTAAWEAAGWQVTALGRASARPLTLVTV
jgi:UDPglucose 6-dehydrogenase